MIYRKFQDIQLSGLGLGMMRLPYPGYDSEGAGGFQTFSPAFSKTLQLKMPSAASNSALPSYFAAVLRMLSAPIPS